MANRTFKRVTLEGFLHLLANEAKNLMRGEYSPMGVSSMRKADGTVVTDVDLAISREVRKLIGIFQTDPVIIDEESDFPEHNPKRGRKFILDPLDGTQAHIHGRADSVFVCAIMQDSVPLHAVVLAPLYYDAGQGAREYTATRGRGAFLNINRNRVGISVSTRTSGQRIALAVSKAKDSPYDGYLLAHELFANHGMVVETLRSISHECVMLASGHIDGVIFPWGSLHDAVAGDLLVREAGGVTSDLCGDPLDFSEKNVVSKSGLPGFIMANNRETHAVLLEAVQEHRLKN